MTNTQRSARIEWHSLQTLKNFAAGRPELARFHCRIFTRLARERAASFFNEGTGAPGLRNPQRADMPSPYLVEDGAGDSAMRN